MIQELLTPDPPSESWKATNWDRLLAYLDKRTVIPIVGPDLIHVEIDGVATRLDSHVARCLALNNKLSDSNLPSERPLNYVVCQLLRQHKEREDICDEINEIMKCNSFRPSETLMQLAQISAFNLFVTTTFDPLLEIALKEVRFGNIQKVKSISYLPSEPNAHAISKIELTEPLVYYLFGKFNDTGDFVISDEELLEYVCGFQSESKRPERLFDDLMANNILLLGEEFSDWLARIFLRTTRGIRLSENHKYWEWLADRKTHGDAALVSFLRYFSKRTRIFFPGGAVEFVKELWERWRQRHPHDPVGPEYIPGSDMPKNGIFISYAKEDLQAVQKLRDGLAAAGLPVWLDKESLHDGDHFDPKIEEYISTECSCFLAVVSTNTERRDYGYFRLEWNLASDRARKFHHERTFIIPVIVDDTDNPVVVPPSFKKLNYARLVGGSVTEKFVRRMKTIVSGS